MRAGSSGGLKDGNRSTARDLGQSLRGVPQGRSSCRSRVVGRKRRPEGSPMIMRKTSLILLGAAAGVAVTLIATQPRIMLDGARAQAAAADTYRQLSLFGDVFERVRADYVEK